MTRLCMVYSWEHHRHVVIRREISTLCAAGCGVVIHDMMGGRTTEYAAPGAYQTKPSFLLRVWRRGCALLMAALQPFCAVDGGWNIFDTMSFWLGVVRAVPILALTDAEAYQAHDLPSLVHSTLAARIRRAAVIYDAHELESEQGKPGSPANRHRRRLEKKFLKQADLVIAPNTFRARFYASGHSLKREPAVIMNCPPTRQYSRSSKLHERLGLAPDTRVVLYHGSLMAGRGLTELLHAASLFDPGIVLVMIGAQNEFFREALEPASEMPGVKERVFFVPYMEPDQVMNYVCSAALGVVIYEPVNLNNFYCAPTKMYELLMAGVPILGNDLPEIRSLVNEYQVGAVIDSIDAGAIAAAVNRFLSESSSGCGQVQAQMAEARKRFNWEVEGQKLVRAILGVCAVESHAA